jgi:hypothetical protein
MKAWKILAGLLALAGVLAASGALWIGSVAARRKGEMERRVAGLIAEARARDPVRPVLYGDAVPGNAWDDYDRALVLVHGATDAFPDVDRFLARDPAVDRDRVDKALFSHGKAMDALKSGAHRAQGAYPSTWESGSEVRRPVLTQSRFLVMFAAAWARHLVETGKTREAVRLLLDAVQFSHDLSHNGFDFGYSSECYRIPLEELRHLVVKETLSREELAELEQGLERADAFFPSLAVCAKNAVLVQGVELLKNPAQRAFNPDIPPGKSWRYGFSDQIIQADALEWWCRAVDQADVDDRGSWAEALEARAALDREIRAGQNPLLRFVPRHSMDALWAREIRAQIRLVRAAAGTRDLEDPFGARLIRSETRIWSVGPDGADDGGDRGGEPGWFAPSRNSLKGLSSGLPKDIVIERRR